MKPPWKAAACAEGGYLEPFVLLEPPAHNTGCCVIGLTYSSFVSFFVFTAGCKASGPLDPLCTPWNPWNIQLSQGTGQGVSMTFNAASRLRSLEDRSAALGSSRCELPGMHSVPKSAVLPYASGVGGLSRRLLNMDTCRCVHGNSKQHLSKVDTVTCHSRSSTLAFMLLRSLSRQCGP